MWPPQQSNRMASRLILFILLCACIYGAWKLAYPSGTWRYKLTVEIETPEGVKTGSAVREVHAETGPQIFPDANPVYHTVRGEAVVVDLGERGQVFALLKTYDDGIDGGFLIVNRAYPFEGDPIERVRYYNHLIAEPVVLMPEYYPVLVHFRDPLDPKTVENLLEYKACADKKGIPRNALCLKHDRFADAFGSGVRLGAVTVAMTTEPVTNKLLENHVPWFESRSEKPGYIGANPNERVDTSGTWLTPGDFRKGIIK